MQVSPRLPLLRCLLALLCLAAPAVQAQATAGVGEDATVLRRGEFRLRGLAELTSWGDRYGERSARRASGSREPLGLDLTVDSLGPSRIESLLPVQSTVRTLAGLPEFSASLGAMIVNQRNVVTRTPVMLEYGVSSRLTLGVMVPFVTAIAEVDLRMNPTGREGNVGLNPARFLNASLTADAALVSAFDIARTALNTRVTTCTATPGASGCSGFNTTAAAALVARTATFTNGLVSLYGGRGSTGSPFVPVAGSAAQAAIETKVAALRAEFLGYGTTVASGNPIAAAPLTGGDVATLLGDQNFGFAAKPIAGSITRGVGDAEFSAKFLLLDPFAGQLTAQRAPRGFQLRQSVGVLYRMGSGRTDLTTDFTDLGTGDHQHDIELRSWTDLFYGPQLWLTVGVARTQQMADRLERRIPAAADQPLAAAYRSQTVARDLGDITEVTITPRWSLNEWVGLAAQWQLRTKGEDRYSGTFTTNDLNGSPVTLDASVLGQETGWTEHRLGVGMSYSTVAAYDRGKASMPIEITWMRTMSARGSGGNLPVAAQDLIQLRWYGRLFRR